MLLNVHQALSGDAFCHITDNGDKFCGKYCDTKISKWCYTHPNSKAWNAMQCDNDDTICRPEWSCTGDCRMTLFNPV